MKRLGAMGVLEAGMSDAATGGSGLIAGQASCPCPATFRRGFRAISAHGIARTTPPRSPSIPASDRAGHTTPFALVARIPDDRMTPLLSGHFAERDDGQPSAPAQHLAGRRAAEGFVRTMLDIPSDVRGDLAVHAGNGKRQRDDPQVLGLERQEEALDDGDRAMLADPAEAWLHAVLRAPVAVLALELHAPVGDDVARCATDLRDRAIEHYGVKGTVTVEMRVRADGSAAIARTVLGDMRLVSVRACLDTMLKDAKFPGGATPCTLVVKSSPPGFKDRP